MKAEISPVYAILVAIVAVVGVIAMIVASNSTKTSNGELTAKIGLVTTTTQPKSATATTTTTAPNPQAKCQVILKQMRNVNQLAGIGTFVKCSKGEWAVDQNIYITATVTCTRTASNGVVTTKVYNPFDYTGCAFISITSLPWDSCTMVGTLRSCLS